MTDHETALLGEKASACREVIDAALTALKNAMIERMVGLSVSSESEPEVINLHKSISLIDGVRAAIDTFVTTGEVVASYSRQARAADKEIG